MALVGGGNQVSVLGGVASTRPLLKASSSRDSDSGWYQPYGSHAGFCRLKSLKSSCWVLVGMSASGYSRLEAHQGGEYTQVKVVPCSMIETVSGIVVS